MPNISGTIKYRYSAIYAIDGVFINDTKSKENSSNLGWDNSSGKGCQFKFDASKSNAIYGNSTTVQQNAIKLLPVLRY